MAHLVQLEEKSTMALLEEITSLLPPAWQYPEVAAARVQLGEVEFKTRNFHSSRWSQKADFTATDGRKGVVEVVYLAERPPEAEGPFLTEERNLINAVAEGLKGYWERKRLESEILEISEREQRRIGQDLHDGLTQHLRGIVYLNHVLHERLVQKSLPEATDSARITQLLDQAVDQARSLAQGLFPVELAATGLMHALRALAVTFKGIYGVSCRFVCPEPVLIHDNPTATHLYRIAQEAVQNAIRHGKATRVVIVLSTAENAVTLCIKDNGQGFPQSLPKIRGMGLEIMKHRARTIGGQLSHKPGTSEGTILTCVLPARHGLPTERTS
jgi:signal transduction histidine kinase